MNEGLQFIYDYKTGVMQLVQYNILNQRVLPPALDADTLISLLEQQIAIRVQIVNA